MTKYDERHGGPFDRGYADFWYHRPRRPHFFVRDTYLSEEITKAAMTEKEIEAYHAGYDAAEAAGGQKDYG